MYCLMNNKTYLKQNTFPGQNHLRFLTQLAEFCFFTIKHKFQMSQKTVWNNGPTDKNFSVIV